MTEGEYNAEKDVTFTPNHPADQLITLRPQFFAIFLPEDGHAPFITDTAEFRQIIFKMKQMS